MQSASPTQPHHPASTVRLPTCCWVCYMGGNSCRQCGSYLAEFTSLRAVRPPQPISKLSRLSQPPNRGPVAIFTSSTRRTETRHDNRRSRLGHAGLYPYIAQSKASIAPPTNTSAVGKRGSKSRIAVEQAAIAPARRPPSANRNNETTPAITSPMPIGAIPTAAAALRQYPLRCWDMHRLSSNNGKRQADPIWRQ
jgi:hypothetical protein